MPSIDDYKAQQGKKKFKKTAYRGWDPDILNKIVNNKHKAEHEFDAQEPMEPQTEAPKAEAASTPKTEPKPEPAKAQSPEPKEAIAEPQKEKGTMGDDLGDKRGSQKGTNRGHIEGQKGTPGDDLGDNGVQIGEHNRVQRGTNKGSKQGTHLQSSLKPSPRAVTNLNASGSNEIIKQILDLTGPQKIIFESALQNYIENNQPISFSKTTLQLLTSNTFDNNKTAIKRLVKKGFVERVGGVRGRGGTTILAIGEVVRPIALKALQNLEQLKLGDAKGDKKEDSNSYISSSNINTITTDLEDPWKQIDCTPLSDIGLNYSHIKQLSHVSSLTPELVQESIHHFAYGLEHNPKAKEYARPINVFMGVLRKGNTWIENGYKSAKEIALEEQLKRRKAERERLQKLEQALQDEEFEDWFRTQNKDEINKQFASSTKNLSSELRNQIAKEKAKQHWIETVWEQKKQELV